MTEQIDLFDAPAATAAPAIPEPASEPPKRRTFTKAEREAIRARNDAERAAAPVGEDVIPRDPRTDCEYSDRCSFRALHRCPSCRRALCNSHAKHGTTMYGGDGRRRCVPCGAFITPEPDPGDGERAPEVADPDPATCSRCHGRGAFYDGMANGGEYAIRCDCGAPVDARRGFRLQPEPVAKDDLDALAGALPCDDATCYGAAPLPDGPILCPKCDRDAILAAIQHGRCWRHNAAQPCAACAEDDFEDEDSPEYVDEGADPDAGEYAAALRDELAGDPEAVAREQEQRAADAERGRAIMREIVERVVRERPEPGGLHDFALMWDGLREDGPESENLNPVNVRSCGDERRGDFCAMFHSAPDPNAAAFDDWLRDDKAFVDLARCPWYRASFAWEVARSLRWRGELAEAFGIAYELDDTGAIVSPADYRPEHELAVGATFNGARVLRFEVVRGPRRYMDHPAWWPRAKDPTRPRKRDPDAGRIVQRVSWRPDITAFVEYEPGSTLAKSQVEPFDPRGFRDLDEGA